LEGKKLILNYNSFKVLNFGKVKIKEISIFLPLSLSSPNVRQSSEFLFPVFPFHETMSFGVWQTGGWRFSFSSSNSI